MADRHLLGDGPAHRDADDVSRLDPQVIEQRRRVVGHVAEQIGHPGSPAGAERGGDRAQVQLPGQVGRQAGVAIVEADHAVAGHDDGVHQAVRPEDELAAQTGDEEHRRVLRMTMYLVGELE